MRKLLLAAVLGILTSVTSGCVIPGYSGDATTRVQELIHTSENQRLLLDEWQRTWFLDQPDHCTPYRTHGGII